MAVSFTRFSWCLWAQGKDKEPVSGGSSSSSSSFEFGFGLKKMMKNKKVGSSAKSKWQSRELERKTEPEFDFVVVSGNDSDSEASSEISIGWMEPHGPGFRRGREEEDEDEEDGGFAVLVPCYSPGSKELVEGSSSAVFRAINNLPIDCKDYMDQVLQFRALVPRNS